MKSLPLLPPLTTFENSVHTAFRLLQLPDEGTTAVRPTISLLTGQQFFDTTLGKPIWWNGAHWVDATGTMV